MPGYSTAADAPELCTRPIQGFPGVWLDNSGEKIYGKNVCSKKENQEGEMREILNTGEKRKQLIISYIVFAINGMLALSVGSLLPFVREAKGLDYVFCGLIVSLHSCGNLASSFLAGMLPVLIGRKKTILIFDSLFGIAYLLILFSDSRSLLALAFLMTGLARGAASNFNNATINSLAPGKAWLINGLHAMFSIGAFVFPLLLTALTAAGTSNWVYACYFMLAMGILSFILYIMIPVEEHMKNKAAEQRKKTDWGFFKEPLFWLCTATLFFYLCAEQGVIGWMITYFKDTGLMSSSLSQVMASVLWIMILAGRLTVAYLSTRMDKTKLLKLMSVGFVLFFLVLLFGRSTWMIVLGIMGFGYSMAGIYPTTVSFAGNIIEKYEISWSFILTIASLGSILMPSIIGKIAETSGIAFGMSSIVVVVAVDMLFIFLLTRLVKRQQKQASDSKETAIRQK